jgi:hypothetical protein
VPEDENNSEKLAEESGESGDSEDTDSVRAEGSDHE